uniref:uncharacterized protein zgc:193726 isoform X1 n=1 Tax=Solea senegalensis TaxID=28829 RepID=UPI001CD89983|nr:uncharacterized protein zgc:193726 isoform X1 [Solea senegalensis]
MRTMMMRMKMKSVAPRLMMMMMVVVCVSAGPLPLFRSDYSNSTNVPQQKQENVTRLDDLQPNENITGDILYDVEHSFASEHTLKPRPRPGEQRGSGCLALRHIPRIWSSNPLESHVVSVTVSRSLCLTYTAARCAFSRPVPWRTSAIPSRLGMKPRAASRETRTATGRNDS